MNTVLTSRLKLLAVLVLPGIFSGCMGLSTSPNWRYTDPARLSPERYPVQAPQLPNRPIPVQPGQPSPVDILPPDSPDTYAQPDAASTFDSKSPGSDTIETQRPSGGLPEIDPDATGPQIITPQVDGQPSVELEIRAPRRRAVDSRFEATILVTNQSTEVIPEVAVEVQLGDGLVLPGRDDRRVQRPIGTLAPGDQRKFPLTIQCTQMGELCADYLVLSDGIEIARTRTCTTCIEQSLAVAILGPAVRTIGSRAEYQLRVVNPTDRAIEDVSLLVGYSESLNPTAVSTGFAQDGNQLSWDFGTLQPGETVQVESEFECLRISDQCYVTAVVQQASDEIARDEVRLDIQPVSGNLDLQISDDVDPVGLGGTSEVTVSATNRGLQPMRGIKTTIQVPESLRVENVQVQIDGKRFDLPFEVRESNLEFAPVPELGSEVTVEYRVSVKALQPSDNVIVASATNELRTEPVVMKETLSVTPEPATEEKTAEGQTIGGPSISGDGFTP